MDLQTLIESAPSAAVAIVVLYLFITGRIHSDHEFRRVETERDEYKKALDTERQTVNETVSAAAVTNKLIGAVVSLAADRQGVTTPHPELPTAKDLGL